MCGRRVAVGVSLFYSILIEIQEIWMSCSALRMLPKFLFCFSFFEVYRKNMIPRFIWMVIYIIFLFQMFERFSLVYDGGEIKISSSNASLFTMIPYLCT